MGEESPTSQPPTGAIKQLSAAMEHMRFAVTLPEQDPDTYGIPGFIQPVRKPRTDASNNPEKRSDPFQFGSRFLEEGHDIFEFNAWDHVQTDEAYGKFAEEQYARQRESPVDEAVKSECEIRSIPTLWRIKLFCIASRLITYREVLRPAGIVVEQIL
jgi:tRNAThr (cytosine32-N3)-methyltransferase